MVRGVRRSTHPEPLRAELKGLPAHRNDHPGALGGAHEPLCINHVTVGMAPPKQGLEPGDTPVVQFHHGLVPDEELAPFDTAPHLGLKTQPLERGGGR